MRRDIWGPLAGIAFAVLFPVGLVLYNLPVGGGASSDEEIRAFYADGGDRMRVVVATYLVALAALAFAAFVAYLSMWLRAVDAAAEGLGLVVLVAGAVAAAMLLAGAVALGALGVAIALGGEPETLGDTGVARFLGHLGYGLVLLCGAFSAALLIVAASFVGLRTRALPTWLVWGGFVAAAVLLVAVVFLPMLALPLWVLAVSIVLLRRPAPIRTAAEARSTIRAGRAT